MDGRDGLLAGDETIAQQLRGFNKPIFLVVNKIDGTEAALATAEFQALGMGQLYAIAAAHGRGVNVLMDDVLAVLPDAQEEAGEQGGIKVALVGRPNVGKSTLINRLVGDERVVAFDRPGTTRDSIFIPFEHEGRRYTLIDTAGVRRRRKVTEAIEKFSVIKTLQAIEAANVVMLVLDAHEGLADQDATLAGLIVDSGRALVIVVNKWDGLEKSLRQRVRTELDRRLPFLDFAETHFISALHGTGVGHLMDAVDEAYAAAMKDLATSQLTRVLEDAVMQHPPPLVRGRRIKLRYAHQGGRNPPVIVVHGNQIESLPEAYKRYLINYFRKAFELGGTPLRVEFKSGINPFAGRKNVLTRRQVQKRQRLARFVKKKR